MSQRTGRLVWRVGSSDRSRDGHWTKARPVCEPLEKRELLNGSEFVGPNGKPINFQDLKVLVLKRQNGVPLSQRRLGFVANDGTQVIVTLYGKGTLAGTKLNNQGQLQLVYDNTDANSRITGTVSRGNGRVQLASIRDADAPIGRFSGTGIDPISRISMPNFDLVEDGQINLTGGIGVLSLRSLGPNTQVHLKSLPGTIEVTSTTSVVNTVTTLPTAGSGTTGGTSFVSTPETTTTEEPNSLRLQLQEVNGRPNPGDALKAAQVFGYDPVSNTLIRFDTGTGQQLQTISLAGLGTATTGVGLGRAAGRQVALIGNGQEIRAFDVVTGTPAGQFSIANLGAIGMNTVDGIGSTDTRTFLSDASAGATGLIQSIDLTASLARGQAVTIGAPFAPQRELDLTGGLTGVAGTDTLYSAASAHFDAFQPNAEEAGILTADATTTTIRETARTALSSPTGISVATVPGSARANPNQALGSVETRLALVTGFDSAAGTNTVSLYNPSTLAVQETIRLRNANRLAGLSESFHPELEGAALVDVQGFVRSVEANQAQGLVLNVSGSLNLVQIGRLSDSAIVARPVSHLNVHVRNNVLVRSTDRVTSQGDDIDDRNGVQVVSNLRPLGPLSLPRA